MPNAGSESTAGTPSHAAAPATYGLRLAALVIDWLLCLITANGLMRVGLLPEHDFMWPSVVLVAVYTFFLGLYAQTPGMRVCRIRCVGNDDGNRLGVARALVRAVLLAAALPALTAFVDPERRGLHDKAAGSIVVK